LNELLILGVIFIVLNILDGLTTWACIYRLPEGIRAREANPLFKDVERSLVSSMIRKGFLVLIGLWVFLYMYNSRDTSSTLVFRALDLAMLFTVFNNTYVYISRRVRKRITQTPICLTIAGLQRLRVPERVATFLAFYIVGGTWVGIAYCIAVTTI